VGLIPPDRPFPPADWRPTPLKLLEVNRIFQLQYFSHTANAPNMAFTLTQNPLHAKKAVDPWLFAAIISKNH